ncbi:hypothetical protein DAPPUDRAFT_333277 [Daphnia pulex]|uniref:Uncharacterized protein n=1 Tax=Daphnia pulex TaxID=6669 RepID=E9HSE3_DAPPU|nr:hypothetical protein DAPPUDRAFT_333277 [Daphnia pulex]|eukprot:EFX65329.1 hypothetical protein DAPPUDRAFT_333277 [Daphnia pulex]
MPFRAKPNSQNQGFCTRNCAKLAKSDQTQNAATTETRQMARRRNSLTVLSQPGTPLPTASVQSGHKRERATTPTSSPSLPGPAFKKGKDEMSVLLSTLSQVSLSSLNKSDLIVHLKSCMSHMLEMDHSVYLDRISELESTVEKLKTELVDSKLAFADKVISDFKCGSVPAPAPQTFSYADTVRGAVLVASYAKGEKPAVPLNIASVRK